VSTVHHVEQGSKRESLVLTISGAAGAVGSNLANLVAGNGLGPGVRIDLRLLVTQSSLYRARGLAADLEDLSAGHLSRVSVHVEPERAFVDCDLAVLAASRPRAGSTHRSELGIANRAIAIEHSRLLLDVASPRVRVAVIANPVNSLVSTILRETRLSHEQVSGVVRIDLLRARRTVASRSDSRDLDLDRIAIWGNHSSNLAVDLQSGARDATKLSPGESPPTLDIDAEVARRGDEILALSGSTATHSAALAAWQHIREWLHGTPRGVWSAAAFCSPDVAMPWWPVALTVPAVATDGVWRIATPIPPDPRVIHAVEAARDEIRREVEGMSRYRN